MTNKHTAATLRQCVFLGLAQNRKKEYNKYGKIHLIKEPYDIIKTD